MTDELGSAPTVTFECGARDPDNPSRIHAHSSLEMARDAADWWRLDGKVYVRNISEWRLLND